MTLRFTRDCGLLAPKDGRTKVEKKLRVTSTFVQKRGPKGEKGTSVKAVEHRYLNATTLRNLFIIVVSIDSIHNMACLTVKISPHSPATVDGVDGMVAPS